MRLLLLAAPAMLVLLTLAGCTDDEGGGTCSDVASDVKTVEVHLGTSSDGKMYLTPTALTASQGEKVRFKVINDDATVFHDLALRNYNGKTIEHEVDAGKTVCTFTDGNPYFTATAKGSYEVYCEVTGHKDLGMKGTFTVA
jgi:uncharacterized cupredoxin-like copper-binding protein